MTRLFQVLLAAAAAGLVLAPGAGAATVAVNEIVPPYFSCGSINSVRFDAGGGEVNRVTLTQVDVLVDTGLGFIGPCNVWSTRETVAVASDSAAPLNAGARCGRLTSNQVSCEVASGLDELGTASLNLGDRADALALSAGTPSAIAAGSGDDQLRTVNGVKDSVDCGDGFDTITADAADQLSGCESVTKL